MSRRTPQQSRSKHSAQRIMDAAGHLISSAPEVMLSTTDIAREAGVAIGTVYAYFTDADAVVRAWVAQDPGVRVDTVVRHALARMVGSVA